MPFVSNFVAVVHNFERRQSFVKAVFDGLRQPVERCWRWGWWRSFLAYVDQRVVDDGVEVREQITDGRFHARRIQFRRQLFGEGLRHCRGRVMVCGCLKLAVLVTPVVNKEGDRPLTVPVSHILFAVEFYAVACRHV